jgi:hypothetical protein
MFQKNDLGRLLAVNTAPAVSMFLPTHTAGREIRQDVIRFRNLLSEATEKLVSEHGLRRPGAESLLGPAAALLQDERFWRHQDRGLAMFIANGSVQLHRVPVELPEEVSVGQRFAVRPLLPLLASTGSFMILAVSSGMARLYSATRFGIAEEQVLLPRGVPEINLDTEQGEADLIAYLGRLSRTVEEHLKNVHCPVVLVAEDENQGHFRKETRLRTLLGEGVKVNPDALDVDEMHRRAYDIVKPLFEQANRAALEEYRALSGDPATASRTMAWIEDIVQAARDGRVATLLMVEGEKVWGRYSEEYDRYFSHTTRVDGAVDLLECAAAETLMREGRVHLVDKDELPMGSSAVAVLRF